MSSPERKGKTMDVLEPTQDFYGDLEVNRVGITKNFSVRWKFKIDNRKLTIENRKTANRQRAVAQTEIPLSGH